MKQQQQEEIMRRQQQGAGMSLSQQDMRRRQQSEDAQRHANGMQMRGNQGQMNQSGGMGGPNQGLLANPNIQALQALQGLSGGNANGGRMGPAGQGQPIQQRASRFDQPPQNMGGRGQAGAGGMGGPQQGGGSYRGGSTGGPRPLEEIRTRPPPAMERREMERRERHDEYMAKRPRHY